VAISVITIGVLAAFNVVQNITGSFRTNASQLTATYLAQEGIEFVRNQRDSNWLAAPSGTWGNNKTNLIGTFDIGPQLVSGVSGGKFTRNIDINDQGSYIVVSAGVSWEDRGTAHSVTSTTELYNWLYP
jgi:hypothetical protein